MLLSVADQLQGNKNKVFKRLLERKTPLTVLTTLSFTGPSPKTPDYPPRQQKPGEEESLYCLPQDIVSAVDEQLRAASISSTSTASSTGSAHQYNRSPALPDVPPLPLGTSSAPSSGLSRPNPINRASSDPSRTKKKEKFFKKFSKNTCRQDQARSLSESSRTEEIPSQVVPQEDPASQHDDQYADMENVVLPEAGTNSSFDEESLHYEDLMGVNRSMTASEDLPGKAEKIQVKTLALCWWSEKLNEMTDCEDSRYLIYRVIALKPN